MKSDLEVELIDKVLKGDKEAFSVLVDTHYSYCLSKANRMIGDQDVAKDLTQNSFIQAYFCLSNLKDKSAFKFWLSGILNNICKNYLRDNEKKYLSLKQYYGDLRSAENLEEEKIVDVILKGLKCLDSEYQQVIYLFYYEGKSINDICNELLITKSLVKVRLHRARRELKTILELNTEFKEYQQYFNNRSNMKEVRIIDMILAGENRKSCSLLLYDENSSKVLPIVITKEEAEAMLIAMKSIHFPRPLTFNLITEIIRTNNLVPKGAFITEILNGVFISTLKLKSELGVKDYDTRPSDAITIALMFNCPIYISQKILDRAGFPVPEKYQDIRPQEKGIDYLTQLIENSLLDMEAKLESLKAKKSVNDIQQQIDKLMDYVFGDSTAQNQNPV